MSVSVIEMVEAYRQVLWRVGEYDEGCSEELEQNLKDGDM